ncbi:hypothetical protein FA95DRAFT_1565841, partial [Auriscalpium vulgare]
MTVQSTDCDQTLGSSNSANPARDVPCGSPALASFESRVSSDTRSSTVTTSFVVNESTTSRPV